VTFVEDVRSELCRRLPLRACCRAALLGAIVRTAGSFHLQGRGDVHVEVDLGANVAARRVVELARGLGAACEIRSYRAPRLRGEQRFTIVLGGDPRSLQAMHEVGVLGASLAPLNEPPARVLARSCCRAAYLRGAFLAAGSVSAPRRPAHLEIRTHDVDGAAGLARIAAVDGIELRVRDRGRHAAAYAKRVDTIADLLARIGADDAALRLAEADVVARAKERANRSANCDAANLGRQVAATRRQLDAIDELEASGELDALPAVLQEAAALRREHPGAALQELAELAEPPVPKPTIAARLRRLVEHGEAVDARAHAPGRAR
jgi:cell division protein WhiA